MAQAEDGSSRKKMEEGLVGSFLIYEQTSDEWVVIPGHYSL